jgi:hypothetical protein
MEARLGESYLAGRIGEWAEGLDFVNYWLHLKASIFSNSA